MLLPATWCVSISIVLIQYFLCISRQKTWIRLLPAITAALATAVCLVLLFCWEGNPSKAAQVDSLTWYAAIDVLWMSASGLGWLIWGIVNNVQKSKK